MRCADHLQSGTQRVRSKYHRANMKIELPRNGQESVWDYPRPPRVEKSARQVRVNFAGQELALSSRCYRVLETSHPPSWYIPQQDVNLQFLIPTGRQSFCEWKGTAKYWTVKVGETLVDNVAWSYDSPTLPFVEIRGCLAFYPGALECYVDEERVASQTGGFYGGWITKDVIGPFKGVPGSGGW